MSYDKKKLIKNKNLYYKNPNNKIFLKKFKFKTDHFEQQFQAMSHDRFTSPTNYNVYNSLNHNSQRLFQQPLYPKFFQEQAQINTNFPRDNSNNKKRHQIFEKEPSKEKSIEFGIFEASMTNNNLLKDALAKEIKENIDSVKEDLLESFRKVLDNFRNESIELNQKIENIQEKEHSSDGNLENFDNNLQNIRVKLQDITNIANKIPTKADKSLKPQNKVKENAIIEAIQNKVEDFNSMHKNTKKTLFEQKENIQKYLSEEIQNKNLEKITESRLTIEKTSKVLKDMNKGWEQKTHMIKDQLDRKFKISERKIKFDIENLETNMTFEHESEIFNELDSKMQAKFGELRLQVDEMSNNLIKKLSCQEVERFFSEIQAENLIEPFIREFKELGMNLEEQKRRFVDFKDDLIKLLEVSRQKLVEVMRKKEGVVERRCNGLEKTYNKIADYQVQIDKIGPLIEGLSAFCSKFHDFEGKMFSIDRKIPELKEEIQERAIKIENFMTVIEEMKDTQEHFSSKLDLIWQHFSNLQDRVQNSQEDFFKEIESFHQKPESNKIKTPIKTKENFSKSPFEKRFEDQNILKSPLQKTVIDYQNIKVNEYFSPESFRNNRDMKITSSPVVSLNLNAFSLGKSPLGAEMRALVNQNKTPTLGGDNDNFNNTRWSSFGKVRGISLNYERLSEIGFKNCEETGFQINDEGMVLGVDGKIILDSEGKPIKLLPEYMDFLSHNKY